MTSTDLHEILAIYFDLTNRPYGRKLVLGELTIEDYIKDMETRFKKNVLILEKDIQSATTLSIQNSYKLILKDYVQRLERIEYWKKRGYQS